MSRVENGQRFLAHLILSHFCVSTRPRRMALSVSAMRTRVGSQSGRPEPRQLDLSQRWAAVKAWRSIDFLPSLQGQTLIPQAGHWWSLRRHSVEYLEVIEKHRNAIRSINHVLITRHCFWKSYRKFGTWNIATAIQECQRWNLDQSKTLQKDESLISHSRRRQTSSCASPAAASPSPSQASLSDMAA